LYRYYSIIAALLFVSFGFTSAFAQEVMPFAHSQATTQVPVPDSLILSQPGFDSQDNTANLLAVLLLGIPFGVLVYRMSDSDPIPLKYAKLSGFAVALGYVNKLRIKCI